MEFGNVVNVSTLVVLAVHLASSVWWASKITVKQDASVSNIKILYRKLEALDVRVRGVEIQLGGGKGVNK